MSYFIGYNLEGEAKRYHETLTRDLSERFGLTPLHERVPPHCTLYPSFLATPEHLEEIEKVIENFIQTIEPMPVLIDRFVHFGHKTIALYGKLTQPGRDFFENFAKEIGARPWLAIVNEKNRKNPETDYLHASVARFVNEDQFPEVWEYIQTLPPPRFALLLDAITIYTRIDTHWEIYKSFPIAQKLA